MGRRSYRTVAGRSTAPGRPRERRAGATRGVASLKHSAPGLAPSASVAGPQQRGADFAATRCASTTSFHSDGGRLMRILIVVGSTLLLASCETRIAPSPPARPNGIAAATVSGAGFTFANFALGAAPGTVCPGSSGCTNGAAEPAIRADATGTFYVSSELGLSAGTLAWKSTDGGLHYTALTSPNQISQAAGGIATGGGDTDLGVAPQANANGIHNVYVASLSLANVTVSTSQDGGQTWNKRSEEHTSELQS